MKLVDILARELKVWPEGYSDIGQAEPGRLHVVTGWNYQKGWTLESYTQAEDWASAVVTCAEWQAAVEALKAEQAAELDWPDGATHYVPPQDEIENGVFYKVENDFCVESWVSFNGAFSHSKKPPFFNGRHHLPGTIVRPTERATDKAEPEDPVVEWKEGELPPVGTVCEVLWNESRMEYLKTKVFAVNEHGQPIHRFEEGPKKYEYQADVLRTASGVPVFRPIRTPEQIAADERMAAAYAMCAIAPSLSNVDAGALYDAFYRKQVAE